MKKIDKEFVLSDSTVNCYGFRLLTEGYMLEEYAKNPIGYFMHDRDSGVLVKWEGLKKSGDKIVGLPTINEANPRGQRTIDEIGTGFLNAASMGHFVVIESSDDPKLKLPGQTGPTITKWYNRECSLVDVPGNFNAIQLYDAKENLLDMKLFASSKKLQAGNDIKPEDNLDTDELLKSAVANKDITKEVADELRKQYYNIPGKLQLVLHDLAQLRIKSLMQMTWDELDKKDLLAELKAKYLTGFNEKFFMKYGVPPKSDVKDKEEDIDKLITFAIQNGDVTPEEVAGWKWSCQNNPERLRELVKSSFHSRVKELKEHDWDKLDKEGLLEELKQKDLQGFKRKYKEKFGIEYKGK